MTKLYLIRHGETEWNAERRMQGHADSPLSANGKQQAQWLAEALEEVPFDVICASSSGRTLQTAAIVKGSRELSVIVSDQWREMNLGAWEGRISSEIEQLEPELYDAFWNEPEQYMPRRGETYADLQRRVLPALEQLVEEHAGKTICLISHTVTLKVIMAHMENRALANLWKPPYFHPTCLSVVEWKEERPHIVLHADTSHFREGEPLGR